LRNSAESERLPRADTAFTQHEARLLELSNANHELLRAAQAARTLKAHAEEAHQRQIEFVVKAAHAMRTPLSVIRMTVEAMTSGALPGRLDTKPGDVLKRQAIHLARLIDDLLDGSLVGGGEFKAGAQSGRHRCRRRQRGRREPTDDAAEAPAAPCRDAVRERSACCATRCAWRRSSATCSTAHRGERSTAATSG
jgi:signal transduction histidine kinase